ncbi:ribonuclease J 1 [Candidatus Phycosocius bacilliformis]|uniref:Ribonuclease J 1 n=1 Tax=Candidatus Phycosocius bacilliformis TaxID=1445552 RepID=A0A2P2EBI7_9PROT|nr:ribonuclease J [Candidatus Phycosocius bacilliformis]GBF58430.1 ribonuclease J 1 [Candidatus Phycosocius bacilliformis]
MTKKTKTDELVFLPLGGSNEIGMNLNAYGYGPDGDRKWIVVDVGVTFAGEEGIPGVDLILPDPEFLEANKDDILAIVLTHAHEDHIGAMGWLWPRIPAPVYATPFTAHLLRDKLRERGIERKVALHEVPLKHRFQLGPFDIEYVTLTHSIAEPNGLAIHTPLGTVLHTGDWKIDAEPLIGEQTDIARLKEMGEAGVLAMVCDSTNVFSEGEAGSEAGVRSELIATIGEQKGKVAVACFASNVARILSTVEAATAAGRAVALIGRSMVRITGAARAVGLLQDASFIEPEQARHLRDDQILYLCTGSQGEPRAALARIADGTHPHVSLGRGDTCLFSSREIPGNERAILELQNKLAQRGVEVITGRDRHIHVSGHPCRDELRAMYEMVRPQIAIPTHGEQRHLMEHAKFALSLQVPEALAIKNGDMVRLAPGPASVIDEVPTGRLLVDGEAVIRSDSETIRDRVRLSEHGYVMVSLAINAKGQIKAGPDVRARGLSERNGNPAEARLEQLADAAEEAFNRLKHDQRVDEEVAEGFIMRAVRKAADRIFGKRPIVDVVVMTV